MTRFFIPCLLGLATLVTAAFANPPDDGLALSGKLTAQGTPEVRMWAAGMPRKGVVGAGFPVLAGARHSAVFTDAVKAGAYNHHAQLAHHDGVFFATWSNHPKGEDAAGQRVLFSISRDGAKWSRWAEGFPPPSEVRGWGEGFGLYAVAGGWRTHENRVYLIARIYDFVGWENTDRTSRRPERDAEHIFQRYEHLGLLAREVSGDGALGPVFALSRKLNETEGMAYPFIKYGDEAYRSVADAIREVPASEPRIRGRLPEPVDRARLVEPATYEAPDGAWISIIRDDAFSHRKYVSVSHDRGATWSPARPTDIPDSPSLDTVLRAPDGTILLIGNHCASAFDNPDSPRHYDRDTLDVATSADGRLFTRAYALRTGVQEWRVPRTVVRGRGGGPQYPSAVIVGDRLHVLYSFGKEDVWCSSVPLADLLPASAAR